MAMEKEPINGKRKELLSSFFSRREIILSYLDYQIDPNRIEQFLESREHIRDFDVPSYFRVPQENIEFLPFPRIELPQPPASEPKLALLPIDEEHVPTLDQITQAITNRLLPPLIKRTIAELDIDPHLPAVAELKRGYDALGDIFSGDISGDEVIETYDIESAVKRYYLTEAARAFVADKGFSPEAIDYLDTRALAFATLLGNLVFRVSEDVVEEGVNAVFNDYDTKEGYPSVYRGSPEENEIIDRSIKESQVKDNPRRQFSGEGATRYFKLETATRAVSQSDIGRTPIVVIGGGPAGLLTVRGLVELGFDPDSITVIDRSGEYRGIWNQKNVASASKNNPFEFTFERLTLDPAPGPGQSVTNFLTRVETSSGFDENLPTPIKGTVTKVEPGDLNHVVHYKENGDAKTITAPIVINALGTGKPLSPSREGYMKTSASTQEAGIRWQQVITPEQAEKLRGKTLVFIGLGNSTGEMLVQLDRLNKDGYGINYRVITHYPSEALQFPESTILEEGKEYHLYRDIKKPNLVKLTGDLPDIRESFERARNKGKIIPAVTQWDIDKEKGIFTATDSDGVTHAFHYDQLYTLIGYGHDPEILRAMGMQVTDEYMGTIAYDYDGEIQKQPGAAGRDRVYPGYYGIGALLKSKTNPNAQVIPGIMHRMYDLLFGVTIRSAEYHVKKDKAVQAARENYRITNFSSLFRE